MTDQDKEKIPLVRFDASVSIEQMAENLMAALQRAGFKTPSVERVVKAYAQTSKADRDT